MKSVACSLEEPVSASPRMLSSSARPYLFRARAWRNCRYSQSCTCRVQALILPRLVFACAQISRSFLYLAWMCLSHCFRTLQKCWVDLPLEPFAILSRALSASFRSAGPPLGSRQRRGGAAPIPTSHWLSRSFCFGYARSMQTVSILAQVSPKPGASCTIAEIWYIFSAALFFLSFTMANALSATAMSLWERVVMLLTRFLVSSLRTRSGMMRKQLVRRGLPVFFRYSRIARSMGPPSAKALMGSCQKAFVSISGSCAFVKRSRLQCARKTNMAVNRCFSLHAAWLCTDSTKKTSWTPRMVWYGTQRSVAPKFGVTNSTSSGHISCAPLSFNSTSLPRSCFVWKRSWHWRNWKNSSMLAGGSGLPASGASFLTFPAGKGPAGLPGARTSRRP
mmetsp:Transcript_86722/g.253804  ORF Transcript_86722/g.253804 Transcript_86722/m.253804 type:complete len:392 (+) Transcript_86722:575-1750(+)